MYQEWVTLGKGAKFFAQRAANVNPVLGRDLHEVDLAVGYIFELVGNGSAQTEAGARDRVLWIQFAHTAQDLVMAAIITLQLPQALQVVQFVGWT